MTQLSYVNVPAEGIACWIGGAPWGLSGKTSPGFLRDRRYHAGSRGPEASEPKGWEHVVPFLRIWQRLISIVTRPKRDLETMQFSLGDRDTGDDQGTQRHQPSKTAHLGVDLPPGMAQKAGSRDHIGGTWLGQKQGPAGRPDPEMGAVVPKRIEDALRELADTFHGPETKDVVFRKFTIQSTPPARAFLAYIEGLANTQRVEREILFPLMNLSLTEKPPRARLPGLVVNSLLPAGGVERKFYLAELVAGMLKGDAVLFTEPSCALVVDIKDPPARPPSEPISERSLRGPQLGFTENFRANTGMIRSLIHDPDLVNESFVIGQRSRTMVSVMYIKDIVNPKLVREVRRRLGSLRVDHVIDASVLEPLIRDHPITLMPTVLLTERVDRTALQLLQGAVAIIVDGSIHALIVPVTFSTFLHSAEDVYLHPVMGTFLRVLRLAGITLATLLPGLYIAVVNHHPEMLPTGLLLAFIAAAEAVAFPAIVSVLFLDISFELIREAGIRIPSPIGPTIGIVGALLIGDAAIRAALVSPITVIVIAMTALSNFIIPDQTISFVARLLRFAFLLLAAVFGLFGIAVGAFLAAVHLASLQSFGVPYLSPVGPWRAGSPDVVLRGPLWAQEKRPIFLRPLNLIRQARYIRAWDPGLPEEEPGEEPGGDGGSRT